MKSFLKGLFSESSSVSMMRVMSILCCLAAVLIAILGLYRPNPDYEGLAMLVAAFLAPAFTGKCWQKKIETSSSGNSI